LVGAWLSQFDANYQDYDTVMMDLRQSFNTALI